jgi:hypothetical protein
MEAKEIVIKRNGMRHILRKHAAAIHSTNPARLLERKIFNILLFNVKGLLLIESEHSIKISEVAKQIEYNGNNYTPIKQSLQALVGTVIEWNIINEETCKEEGWGASSLLADVRIEGGTCYYSYSNQMRNLLNKPSVYGNIDLLIQSKFKSAYGLAIYENCIRYRSLPATRWFREDEFRKLMGVLPGTYLIFRDFKKRVIDLGVKEVNLYADIDILPECEKRGASFKIRFLINQKKYDSKKEELLLIDGSNIEESEGHKSNSNVDQESIISSIISDFSLSRKRINQLIIDYGFEYINEKLKMIKESEQYRKNNIDNLPAFFTASVKNDYKPAKSSFDEKLKNKELKQVKDNIEEEKKNNIIKAQIKFEKHKNILFMESINNLSLDEKESLISEFLEYSANNRIIGERYRKKKFEDQLVLHNFKEFCKKHYQYLLNKILEPSWEEFFSKENSIEVSAR